MNGSISAASAKIYGLALAGCALASLWVLMHHPTLAQTDAETLVAAVGSIKTQSFLVHGAAIALGLTQLICLSGFALMLGIGRPLTLAGLVTWAAGTFALISAAAINGFAVPSLAERLSQGSPIEASAFEPLLMLAWSLNQAFDKIGLVSWGAAVCLWSLQLAMSRGLPRLVGLVGTAAGAYAVVAILSGWLTMGAAGFVYAIGVFSLWTLFVGVLMALDGRRWGTWRAAPASDAGAA